MSAGVRRAGRDGWIVAVSSPQDEGPVPGYIPGVTFTPLR